MPPPNADPSAQSTDQPAFFPLTTGLVVIEGQGCYAVPAWVVQYLHTKGFGEMDERRFAEAWRYLNVHLGIFDPERLTWSGTLAEASQLLPIGEAACRASGYVLESRRPGAMSDNDSSTDEHAAMIAERIDMPADSDAATDREARLIARLLALYAVRNCPTLEHYHSGQEFPHSASGDYSDVVVKTPNGDIPWNKVCRISDPEMRAFMLEAERALARNYKMVKEYARAGTLPKFLDYLEHEHLQDPLISWDLSSALKRKREAEAKAFYSRKSASKRSHSGDTRPV